MADDRIYEEQVASKRTEALFVLFTLLFLALCVWRMMVSGFGALPVVFFVCFCFFLFYSLNYRKLHIHLTGERLTLRFGLFPWRVPWDAVEGCALDHVSLWRIGGAGIHFTSIGGRYRAMFNFLEYPRVVVRLRRKRGLVWDIVFSTPHPERVQRFILDAISESSAPAGKLMT